MTGLLPSCCVRPRLANARSRSVWGSGDDSGLLGHVGVRQGVNLVLECQIDAWAQRGWRIKGAQLPQQPKDKFAGIGDLTTIQKPLPASTSEGVISDETAVAVAQGMRRARATDERIPGHERAITCVAFGAHRVFTGA